MPKAILLNMVVPYLDVCGTANHRDCIDELSDLMITHGLYHYTQQYDGDPEDSEDNNGVCPVSFQACTLNDLRAPRYTDTSLDSEILPSFR